MPPARAASTRPQKQRDGLGRAAGARHVAVDRHERALDGDAGLLLAPRDARPTPRSRHRPRRCRRRSRSAMPRSRRDAAASRNCSTSTTASARRIVEQQADGAAALEHLAHHRRGPAAGIEAVAQPEPVDPEEAAKDGLALEDFHALVAHAAQFIGRRSPTGGMGSRQCLVGGAGAWARGSSLLREAEARADRGDARARAPPSGPCLRRGRG